MNNWNPSNFFTEIIQNANDANATSIEFIMGENGILVIHNGHIFTEDEVRSICSINKSTKKIETETGYMGVGFKSTFSISDSPHILSGPWRFYFSKKKYSSDDWGWILLPHWSDNLPNEVSNFDIDKTYLWLPFMNDLHKNSINEIEKTLFEKFNRICLLFLNNIKEIKIQKEDKLRQLSLINESEIKELIEGNTSTYKYKIYKNKYQVPNNEIRREYKTIKKVKAEPSSREIILVFYLDNEGNLKPQQNLPIYVNLPTKEDSFNLRFAAQADFILDSSRSNIRSIEWNRWIWRCVKNLLISSIEGYKNERTYCPGFKEDGLLKYQFYKILPKNNDSSSEDVIFNEFFKIPFFDYCSKNPIAITSEGKWVKASQAIFASKELQELLDLDKLKLLEGNELSYIDFKAKDAKTFLKEFGAKEIEDEYIVKALEDYEWMESKNISWFNNLYKFLDGAIENWSYSMRYELIILPLILTNNGLKKASEVFLYPKEENEKSMASGIPNIYFPDEGILNEDSNKLFNELGIKEFNEDNIIENLIFKSFETGEFESWNDEQRQKCYDFILHWLNNKKWDIPKEMEEKLSKILIKTEKNELKKVEECYFPLDEIKIPMPNIDFAKMSEVKDKKFYEFIGLNNHPRIIVQEGNFAKNDSPAQIKSLEEYRDWIKKNKLKDGEYLSNLIGVKYCDNWDYITWDEKNSKLMLNHLIYNWDYYKDYLDNIMYYTTHGRTNAKEYIKTVDSYFKWKLINTSWLATTKGLKSPSDNIFLPTRDIKEMAGDYVEYILMPDKYNKENANQLFKLLNIKISVDVESLLSILEQFEMYEPNKDIKNKISKIYKRLGKLIRKDDEIKINPFKVMTMSGKFVPSNEVYWNDEPEIGELFRNIEIIWAPNDVEMPYLEALFTEIGVKKISEYVKREMKEVDSKTEDSWKNIINQRIGLIYSIIKHWNPECFEVDIDTLRSVDLRKINQKKIPITIILENEKREIYANSFYHRSKNIIYICEEFNVEDLAIELTRMTKLDISYSNYFESILSLEYKESVKKLKRFRIGILDDKSSFIEYQEELIDKTDAIDGQEKPTKNIPIGYNSNKNSEDIVKIIEPYLSTKDIAPEEQQITTDIVDNEEEIQKPEEEVDVEWQPQCSADEAEITIIEYTPPESLEKEKQDRYKKESSNQIAISSRNRSKAEIGRWGEQSCFKHLKEEYPNSQVVWLNEEKEKKEGRDIDINCTNRKIYVEVKSTITLGSDVFIITKKEWELMSKEKNNYWLCRIYGAGTKTPEMKIIKNPYGLWKEEKILIEPSELKLTI